MPLQQITADDIAGWDSLDDIANSFEKRGLKPRPSLGDENELVLQLTDDEFIVLVEAGAGESATDFKPDNRNRRTNLVATNDYEEFTFLTRIRSWEGQQHGRIKHQKLSFTKTQMTSESGEKNTVLQKLNSIEYGSVEAIQDSLYDTKQVVKEFYQQFEELRTDLVQEVAGIPDDRGDAKQRYVQVVLDRMIFLYFIQEKRLLDRDIDYLHEKHEDVVNEGGDVYEEFYHPLFFEMLAEGKQDPDFGSLPYLNGGLFSKNPVEEEFEDARLGGSSERTNELFGDILDFLSDWNWNVDERLDIVDPKNLSPAVLGHIFEQTVNQKEMGAYYTPEEITGFMARRTIHPYLLDQLNEAVDAEYEEIDDVFGFVAGGSEGRAEALADGGTVTAQVPSENVQTGHVETLYHDVLTEIHVLDPAVGSGAFLLAAQEVLLDIYMQCIEFFQKVEKEGKGWELQNRTRDELDLIEGCQGSAELYGKREIILNNLYGVDIDRGAVEICKLRLWLSMVADIEDEPTEVEPLPNIDFNIRQGNSLIGYTDVREVANSQGDVSLASFGGGTGESVREMYEDIIEAVERHRDSESSSEAIRARNTAESRITEHSNSLDEKILEQFHKAGIDEVDIEDIREYSPFHWVLEFATVYADGGFDVVIGNPPWERLKASKDEFYERYDEQFRSYSNNKKDKVIEELHEDEEIAEEWEEYEANIEALTEYFNESTSYTLQQPEVGGKGVGDKNDYATLFLERVFDLASDRSYVSQVLPNVVFGGGAGKDLRVQLLSETTVKSICGFENSGIFSGLHQQYKFGVLTFRNSGNTDEILGLFQQTDEEVLRRFDETAVMIPKEVLAEYSPEAKLFPAIRNAAQVRILQTLLDHPSLGEQLSDRWNINPLKEELNSYRDRDRFLDDPDEGDYPVYGGSNIYQFVHDDTIFGDIESPDRWSVSEERNPEKSAKYRIREKRFNSGDLKRAIYETFNGSSTSKSMKGFVNDLLEDYRGDPLSPDDILLDCSEYRIGFRDVSNSTNERTFISAVIPVGVVCEDTLQTLRPHRIEVNEDVLDDDPLHSAYQRNFTDEELFAAVGILNSIPFDFLLGTKVDTHISKYKLEESQIPRLVDGDDWFHFISERAARLNCYGEEFAEIRERLGGIEPATDEQERRTLQAEIDAAAFHAYGLEQRDMQFVLDDFHRVDNPRMMDEEYFDLVFEKYDLLEQEGPYK
jgi:hypothetical protein